MANRSVEIELSGKRNPADTLVKAFADAEKTIDATVYKFNVKRIFKALKAALDRGVSVRLVADKWLINKEAGGLTLKLALRQRRATIRKWNGAKLHAKLVIIDRRYVLSGSYNWTKSATNKVDKKRNTELLLRFNDPADTERFTELFESMWKDAEKL